MAFLFLFNDVKNERLQFIMKFSDFQINSSKSVTLD